MKIISQTIAGITSLLKQFRVERFLPVLLVGFILLTSSNNYPQPNSRDIGNSIHERLQRTDQYSERPKTTGEFLDEARGDVPLDERLHNITRDSAEAMQQLGQEYTSGIKDSARNLRDGVAESGKDLTGRR